MTSELKQEKQKRQLDKINKLYVNESYTIDEACKKVGICKQTYYSIKKKLSPEKPKLKTQKAGSKIKKSHVRNILDDIDQKVKETGIKI